MQEVKQNYTCCVVSKTINTHGLWFVSTQNIENGTNSFVSFRLCNSVTRAIIGSLKSSFGHKSPENRNLENDHRLATSAHDGV